MEIKVVLQPNRTGYCIDSNNRVKKQTEPIKGEYPADITAGTNIIKVNFDIIEQQDIIGIKATVQHVIDSERRLTNGKLQFTFATKHKPSLELQFRKLVLDTSLEKFTKSVAVPGDYVPFVGRFRVKMTLRFSSSKNALLLFHAS